MVAKSKTSSKSKTTPTTTENLNQAIDVVKVQVGEIPADQTIEQDMWWLEVAKGGALIVLGFLVLIWPGITAVVLAEIFAIYLLIVGIVDVVIGIRSVKYRATWFMDILLGIVAFMVGVYILNGGAAVALLTLILLIGLMFIFQGVVDLVHSITRARGLGSRLWSIFLGILGIVAGLIMFRQPAVGGLAFLWVIGFYGLFAGAMSIAIGLGLRSASKRAAATAKARA